MLTQTQTQFARKLHSQAAGFFRDQFNARPSFDKTQKGPSSKLSAGLPAPRIHAPAFPLIVCTYLGLLVLICLVGFLSWRCYIRWQSADSATDALTEAQETKTIPEAAKRRPWRFFRSIFTASAKNVPSESKQTLMEQGSAIRNIIHEEIQGFRHTSEWVRDMIEEAEKGRSNVYVCHPDLYTGPNGGRRGSSNHQTLHDPHFPHGRLNSAIRSTQTPDSPPPRYRSSSEASSDYHSTSVPLPPPSYEREAVNTMDPDFTRLAVSWNEHRQHNDNNDDDQYVWHCNHVFGPCQNSTPESSVISCNSRRTSFGTEGSQ